MQAVNMILGAIVNRLVKDFQTGLEKTDPMYAHIIKRGLLQTSKLDKFVQMGVQGGDHENPNWVDGILTLEELPNWGMKIPTYEVGGGRMWLRRGVVKLEIYYIPKQLSEDDAHEQAYDIMGKLQESIDKINLSTLGADSYGEIPSLIQCIGNSYFESGGPPSSYIFRGKVLWACLTEKPFPQIAFD